MDSVKFVRGNPEQPAGNVYIFARVTDGTYCIGRAVANVYRGVEPLIAAEIKRLAGLDSLLKPEGILILVGYSRDDHHLRAQAISQGADLIYLEGEYDSNSAVPAVSNSMDSYLRQYSDVLYLRQEEARAKAYATILATRKDGSIDELTILNAADALRGAAASALKTEDQESCRRAILGLEFLLGKLPSVYAEHASQLVAWARTSPHNESYGPRRIAEMLGIYERRIKHGEATTINAATATDPVSQSLDTLRAS